MKVFKIKGALYRNTDHIAVADLNFRGDELVEAGHHFVFLEYAAENYIADTWYWVEKNQKVKIIISNSMMNLYFRLLSLPEELAGVG